MTTNFHAHFHTHVNTHSCDCGRKHISAHTHAHVYPIAEAVAMPQPVAAVTPKQEARPLRSPSPVAKHTRSRIAMRLWESSPPAGDEDLVRRIDFLRASEDPWERSLVRNAEREVVELQKKRAKIASF